MPTKSRSRGAPIALAIGAVLVPLVWAGPAATDDRRAIDRTRTPAATQERDGDRAEPPETPIPERWCDGPRRVPEPQGEAAARARRLGIGELSTANRVLTGAPEPAWLEAVRGRVHPTLQWPVDGGRIGRGLGWRRRTRTDRSHNGMDIPAPGGTPVYAAKDGLVLYSDNGVRGFGNVVMMLHPDGTTTSYVHLRAAYLFAGQHALRGQVIGTVGTTGISQGNHLHFEWRRDGVPLDPYPALVGFPLNGDGLPDFARPRPVWDAARFQGFEHLASGGRSRNRR